MRTKNQASRGSIARGSIACGHHKLCCVRAAPPHLLLDGRELGGQADRLVGVVVGVTHPPLDRQLRALACAVTMSARPLASILRSLGRVSTALLRTELNVTIAGLRTELNVTSAVESIKQQNTQYVSRTEKHCHFSSMSFGTVEYNVNYG